ncbi:MAG: hypothetical protein ACK58U_11940 [Rubrivivax sp.]
MSHSARSAPDLPGESAGRPLSAFGFSLQPCSRAAWACDSPSDALICSLSTLKQHLTAFNGLAFTRQHLRDTAAFQVLCQRLEG